MSGNPIILVRGFDPLRGSARDPFTGYNDGTSYIKTTDVSRDFKGFVISFLQDEHHRYYDTVNMIRFHESRERPHKELGFGYEWSIFSKTVPDLKERLLKMEQTATDGFHRSRTFWVFNYYAGLSEELSRKRDVRTIPYFALELDRYIRQVHALTGNRKVNIIAHSMGGVILRHLIQRRIGNKLEAQKWINKIITLGSPLAGITYLDRGLLDLVAERFQSDELKAMDPDYMSQPVERLKQNQKLESLTLTHEGRKVRHDYGLATAGRSKAQRIDSLSSLSEKYFDPASWYCVVGTDPGSYAMAFGKAGEWLRGRGGDGLVQTENAYFRNSPHTFIHKCHGGYDSLISSRASYEAATRFLFGTHRIRLRLLSDGSRVTPFNEHCQYFLSVGVKVRGLDYFLYQRHRDGMNTFDMYRPGRRGNWLTNRGTFDSRTHPDGVVIFDGYLDKARSVALAPGESGEGASLSGGRLPLSVVFRLDLGINAENEPRKLLFWEIGHSDMDIFREQLYIEYTNAEMQDVQSRYGKIVWYRSSGDVLEGSRDAEAPGDSQEFRSAGESFRAYPVRKRADDNFYYCDLVLDGERYRSFSGKLRIEIENLA